MAAKRILEKGLFLAALALVACKGGEDSDTDTGGNDTGDTDTSPVYLEPMFLSITGGFGYDHTNGQIIAVNFPDIASSQGSASAFTVQPYMAVDMYQEPEGDTLTEDDFVCTIVLEQSGPFAKATALGSDTTQPIMVKFNPATATIEHDCDGLLDPAVWGEDLAASLAASGVEWGLGVDASVNSTISTWIEDQVEADMWTEQFDGKLLGARPYFTTTGTITSSGAEISWAQAQAIDSNNRVLWDDTAGSSTGVWEVDTENATGILASSVPASGSYSVNGGPSVIGYEDLYQVFLGVDE